MDMFVAPTEYEVLDRTKIHTNDTVAQVGLLVRVAVKTDKNKQFYLAAAFKDVNGKPVFGCFFNIEASDGADTLLDSCLGRPVLITYVGSNSLGGQYNTLTIEKIEPLSPQLSFAYAKSYFKSRINDNKFSSMLAHIDKQIAKIGSAGLKEILGAKCNLSDMISFSDIGLNDGMLGATAGIITSEFFMLGGVQSSQPEELPQETIDIVRALIVYCEFLMARTKPASKLRYQEWYSEMLTTIEEHKIAYSNLLQSNPEVAKFFSCAKEVIWNMADIQVPVSTAAGIFGYINKCACLTSRIVQITRDLPDNLEITIGNRSYKK